MTTNISTTINVYFDSNHNVQYSPGNQIQVPGDTVETVIWKGTPPLQFQSGASSVASLSNITSDRISFAPGQSFTAGTTDTVTMTINNAGGPVNVSARVSLGIVDTTSTVQPPVVIDGGGSIRNKGTSLWAWELVGILAALAIGLLLGRRLGASPRFAAVATGIVIAGVIAGVAAGFLMQG